MGQLILFIRLFDLGQPVASEIGPKAMRLDLRSSSGRPISILRPRERRKHVRAERGERDADVAR